MLSDLLIQAGVHVKQAQADADALIVSTALSLAESIKPSVVVGTDTDLLVMQVAQQGFLWYLIKLAAANVISGAANVDLLPKIQSITKHAFKFS